MNLLNLLTKEKHVAGVEINDEVIRIAYFRPLKKFGKKIHGNDAEIAENELVLIEEIIPPHIIADGTVVDKKLLGKTLKDIWTKAKLGSNYAIIAIPEDKIYSHIFPFPKTVNETQLKEAINLAIDFQLPFKRNDMYIGWENAGDSNVINEVLISAIPKTVGDDYIEALNYADVKTLALESHLASIARSIKLKLDEASLFTKRNPDGATIFILKDGSLRFSRTFPNTFIKEESFLANEANRIKTSFESEKKIPLVEFPLNQATIRDKYLKYQQLNALTPELQSKWLIALGAAIRGEIPRGQDNRISLLPIGTAEAYAYQKTTAFITFVRHMTIGVSMFFLFAFVASYLYILSLSQINNRANSNVSVSSDSSNIIQKETQIKNTNGITAAAAEILSTTPIWNTLLDDINSRVIAGITISNFSVPSLDGQISMIGIAKDRDTLNQFKKSLQSSTYITGVELPITNLEQKGDVPFSISFRLTDPSMLYYK